jgi:hypothetical protein
MATTGILAPHRQHEYIFPIKYSGGSTVSLSSFIWSCALGGDEAWTGKHLTAESGDHETSKRRFLDTTVPPREANQLPVGLLSPTRLQDNHDSCEGFCNRDSDSA